MVSHAHEWSPKLDCRMMKKGCVCLCLVLDKEGLDSIRMSAEGAPCGQAVRIESCGQICTYVHTNENCSFSD